MHVKYEAGNIDNVNEYGFENKELSHGFEIDNRNDKNRIIINTKIAANDDLSVQVQELLLTNILTGHRWR